MIVKTSSATQDYSLVDIERDDLGRILDSLLSHRQLLRASERHDEALDVSAIALPIARTLGRMGDWMENATLEMKHRANAQGAI